MSILVDSNLTMNYATKYGTKPEPYSFDMKLVHEKASLQENITS